MRSVSTCVFLCCLVKLLARDLLVLFYEQNKYFINPGFGLWMYFTESQEKRYTQNCSIYGWYNAVQVQINLAKYPPETAKILHKESFCFFLRGGVFVCNAINDSNIDLEKFPANKVWQLAKKLESSKSTARHIKQVSCELQATQVNLLRHQKERDTIKQV